MCSVLNVCVLCVSFCFLEVATQSNDAGCLSQITRGVDDMTFNWTAVANGHSVSTPICLNVSFNVVLRRCVDGRWDPETMDECYQFRCPDGYAKSWMGCRAPNCSEVTQRPDCDYPQSYFLNSIEQIGKHALKFNSTTNGFTLTVKSLDAQVRCYANSVSGVFQISSQETIFPSIPSQVHYLPSIRSPAYYWCQVFEGQNFHPSVTEKVVGLGFRHFFVAKSNVTIHNPYGLQLFGTGYENLTQSYESTLKQATKNKHIIYLRSTEFCLPEITDDLHWKLTPIGAVASPDNKLCLDADGRILTRKCEGDPIAGAVWSANHVNCSDVDVSYRTKFLHDVLQKEIDASVLDDLAHLDMFSSTDLYLLSKVLRGVSPSVGPRNFVKIVSNVMRTNLDELRRAQAINSTDEILDLIENFVSAVAQNGPARIVEDYFMVEITNPTVNNITGLAMYRGESKSLSSYRIVELYANQTLSDLPTDGLELAVEIPESLLTTLGKTHTDLRIIIEIFYNDSLFVDATDRWGGSKVVGVRIPGVVDLPEPITMLLRKTSDDINGDCAYWDYGRFKTGQWASDGGATLNNDSLTRCSFTHLTHFALLILSDRLIVEEDVDGVLVSVNPLDAHDLYLTIITGFGCTLSFIGAIVIILSAILLKSWHAKRKFTVQLTMAVSLELVIFQLAAIEDWQKRPILCKCVGTSLHYVILSKFSWMLLVAYVQHSRFIKIFDTVHVSFLKAVIIGWIVPLLLATLSIIIYPDSYTSGGLSFCHVKGEALYIFLLLPIVVVVAVNIAIICLIMVKVSTSQAKKYNKSINLKRKQTSFAVLLFFMLGIPWIFGLTAEFIPSVTGTIIFVYIFCLTATMQGFVMFVFNVLLDADSRKLWKSYVMNVKGKSYNMATATIQYTSTNEDTATTHLF